MEEPLTSEGQGQGGNLLLATDGKPHSAKAIEFAVEMAKLTSSKLFIMYVVSQKSYLHRSDVIKEGMGILQDLKKQCSDQGLDVTTLLEGGAPHQTIVSTAERLKAGAIIVGTSRKSLLDRILIGSVSEYVVRNSACTVIVVK